MARKLIVEIVGDSRSLERSFKGASQGAQHFERDLGKTTRGVIAGSGAFQGLGRSVAFASGYFIGGVGITALLTKSVEAATEAQAAQRQLAAQFRANGQNLAEYQQRIKDATLATSELAGFTETELTRSFTTAFRASRSVAVGLKIQSIAADVARGTHKELAVVTGALTKAYLGQATALKRINVIIPKGIEGMAALEFVQRRFAGQAEAGTTAQERFHAALHNTEVTIGNALLPSLTRVLNRTSKWLNNTENQKRLQKDLADTVSFTSTVLGIGVHAVQGYTLAWDKFSKLMHRIAPGLDQAALRAQILGRAGAGLTGPVGTPTRTQSFLGVAGLSGPVGRQAAPPRTGLHAQFLRSQLALAQAQVTAAGADDRRILSEQAKIIRAAIRQTTNLKKRTELYQQLGSIENQIRSIDQAAQSKREQHQQDLLDARKKALEKQKQLRDKEKAQNQAEIAALKQRESTIRDQIKAIQGRFRDQIATARQGIGDLFTGPVLNPTEEARRHTLGLGAPIGTDPRQLVRDLRAQTAQFTAFQRDLARLSKRGAPAELIRELRAQGLGAASETHALATAGGGTLRQFFRAFGKRETLAVTTAKTVMRSQLVRLNADKVRLENVKQEITVHVHTHLDGKKVAENTTKHQARANRRSTAQRTGRDAGVVPLTIGY